LYAKKQALNKTLYTLHLQNTNEWGNLWNIINQNITQKLEQKMQRKYKIIHNKIRKLTINKLTKQRILQTRRIPN
jgi:hypothetical protein